jgi:hypothetical protein
VNRSTIINTAIAALIVALVAAVFVLEGRGTGTPATTTTSSTSTTVAPTTSTTSTTSTTTTTTTVVTTTTTTTEPLKLEVPFPRELYAVVVVNGSTAGERLEPAVEQLTELGYAKVRGLVGAVRTPTTVIYYVETAPGAAVRFRTDLGLDLDVEILPLDEAPPIAGRNDAQLILYLGGS